MTTRTDDETRPEETRLYELVVVGSSAGGIEALATLVATLPANFPAPLVFAQHLDPTYPSHLGEILARRSILPVRTVTNQEPLLPGVVYVVPADRHVEITDHVVSVRTTTTGEERRRGPKPSVDRLLTTAARVYGERLIAVILTGTGSDGAAGARAVKAAGGLVLIENPATAAYPGMPESLAPTSVDLVADLARIGPLLAELLATTYPLGPGPSSRLTGIDAALSAQKTEPEDEERILQALLAQVRARSGIDFSRYKRPTILRRLQRRLVATGTHQLSDYLHLLASQPEEYTRLVGSFLINVTEFFRDPALFEVLRDQVLPDLILHARTQGNELRLWSAGCATGEEAYSLAILLAEALGEELNKFTISIFATDLDEEAVAFARRGLYPAASLASVPQELRARYFTLLDRNLPGRLDDSHRDRYAAATYEVTPRVRGLVVFGQHDLGQRAPFPRIDLVLCRNVLMYFTPELHRRTLHLFAFALRDGGYLALGKAETAKPLEAYFAVAHQHLKLYRRYGEQVLPPIARIMASAVTSLPVYSLAADRPSNLDRRLELPLGQESALRQALLTHPTPTPLLGSQPQSGRRAESRSTSESLGDLLLAADFGIIVVDQDYDIYTINSAARSLLGIYRVAVGHDLIHLSQNVPAIALRRAIDAAFHQPAPGSALEVALAAAVSTEPNEAEEVVSEDGDTVVIVETVAGEPRHLQITGYPQRQSGPETHAASDGSPSPSAAAGTAAGTSSAAPARVERVVLLVSDVTQLVRRQQAAVAEAAREEAQRDRARTLEPGDLEQAYTAKLAEAQRLRAQVGVVSLTNHALVEANLELAEANLELRSMTDELMVSREEAEASAEEIKTLNEELQATNEELVTVNEELEATVEELHTANEDLAGQSHELQRLAASLEQQRGTSEGERAQLEAILLSMGDALLVVDTDGVPILTNAAYLRLFGSEGALLRAEDEHGQVLPPEQQPNHLALRGVAFRSQFSLGAAEGGRRWFEAAGEPVRNGRFGHGGVITIRDITERHLPHG